MIYRSNVWVFVVKEKQVVRKRLIESRKRISSDMIFRKSRHIQALLFSIEEYQNAQCVGFYVSSGHEVETHEMIRDCFQLGKRVVVPKCGDKEGEMSFCEIGSFEELAPGAFGILEPCDPVKKVDLDEIDVLIVPGVGFDRKGNRLGQGGGYYDSILSLHPRAVTIGVAFSVQLVDNIPVESHDVKVDIIVTENEVITIK
jgi:5-formyltetrahydrofolate cyclo-ligase